MPNLLNFITFNNSDLKVYMIYTQTILHTSCVGLYIPHVCITVFQLNFATLDSGPLPHFNAMFHFNAIQVSSYHISMQFFLTRIVNWL